MTTSSPAGTTLQTKTQSSDDNRLKLLEATMKRHQHRPDALIEVLHKAQELYGYLTPELLISVAQRLHLPPSRVYGVATFYHFFSLVPPGEHNCTICLGTACYVKGAAAILGELEQQLGLQAGQTSADGKISLLAARCLGACGIAPAVVLDGQVIGHAIPDELQTRVAELLK
ncbi:bidirectional hydrogenase complex protein HoxE [Candidatus Viridilinea mediisalina]|uniref:NAD(P)H-dependent oxidoreductase subunit E n=1 Tax=Candidatus Viridilinea mediisalina TaxID=2024553 RepID=A0A2A6REG8_9CHLR|nr:bidirectional hydrogenase complex protein HoxE [Candidatus Viridilinea mediisalina]PDW01133.1 NAD(P)H-dependent oxidoreductase subunit E [Candidatus Viridilinea mediisalina]